MSLFRTTTPFLQNNAWQHQSQNALRYNTSQVGSVLPLCFGTVRQQVNLVALGDFMGPGGGKKGKGVGPLPIAGTNTVAGGKGGGGKGKGKGKKSQDFSVDLAVALCQGPVTFNANNLVFANSSVEAFSATASGAGKGSSGNQLNFYIGDDGQDITHPVGSVNYSGTCVVTATPIDLGPSPAIPNLSFEISALLYTTGGAGFPADANPGEVVTSFLTDPRFGAEFPAANLDDLVGSGQGTTFGEYCKTFGLLISVSLDGQQKAAQWLEGISRLLNTAPVCSGELLKFIPYGDIPFASNGASWNPNLVPVYALTDADFIPWHPHQDGADPEIGQDDPIILTRSNPADAFNWFSIEYLDRANFYNSTVLAVYDQGAIDQYGLRIGDSLPGKCFANAGSAQVAAQLYLQRTQYIRNTYKFQIGWDKALLEPMDIVLLTGSAGDAYLSNEAVRVTSIEENDNGDLTVEAEEVVTGKQSPTPTAVTPSGPIPPANPECSVNLTVLQETVFNSDLSDNINEIVNSGGCVGGGAPPYTCSYLHPDGSVIPGHIGVGGIDSGGCPCVVLVFVAFGQYQRTGTVDGNQYDTDPETQQVSTPRLGNFQRRGVQTMYAPIKQVIGGDPGELYPGIFKQELWWAPAPDGVFGDPVEDLVQVVLSSWVSNVQIWTIAVTGFSAAGVMNPWGQNATIYNANWSFDGTQIVVEHEYTDAPGDMVLRWAVSVFNVANCEYPTGYRDGFLYQEVPPTFPLPCSSGVGDPFLITGIDYGTCGLPGPGSTYMGDGTFAGGFRSEISYGGGGRFAPQQVNQSSGFMFPQSGQWYLWPLWMALVDSIHFS